MKMNPRERETLIRSLRGGVTPAVGLQYIQVGRAEEVKSVLRDIDLVADGGAAFRLVIGEYGSGKTFFLSLARALAMERGLLTMHADLSPTKRLHAAKGETRRLIGELVHSLASRTKRDGQALPTLLQRLAHTPDADLTPLEELPGGAPFVRVLRIWLNPESSDQTRADALRWFRAEYSTRTEARRDLGVPDIITDADLFPTLRLYAALARAAGYKGLYVCLDEMVNLYKIVNAVSRRANYEEILSMLNATLQGEARGLGILLGGTPEFLTDSRRGLYSYEALRSRLAENSLGANVGLKDYDGTVLRLASLTREELYLLLRHLRALFADEDPQMLQRLPDEALLAYLDHCEHRIGEAYFRTPRNTIKGFTDLAALMRQYPDLTWDALLPGIAIAPESAPSPLSSGDAVPDDLVDLRL